MMALQLYDSNNSVTLSDHRAVFAQFLLTFDICGDGFGKLPPPEEPHRTVDDMEITYKNDNIQVSARRRETLKEMRSMSK
jgi:hypothetical protein